MRPFPFHGQPEGPSHQACPFVSYVLAHSQRWVGHSKSRVRADATPSGAPERRDSRANSVRSFLLRAGVLSNTEDRQGYTPVVEQAEGSYDFDSISGQLVWKLPLVDSENSTGSLEFTLPFTRGTEAFFPVGVSFSSTTPYSGILVGLHPFYCFSSHPFADQRGQQHPGQLRFGVFKRGPTHCRPRGLSNSIPVGMKIRPSLPMRKRTNSCHYPERLSMIGPTCEGDWAGRSSL